MVLGVDEKHVSSETHSETIRWTEYDL